MRWAISLIVLLVFFDSWVLFEMANGASKQAESDQPRLRVLTLNTWLSGKKVPDGAAKIAHQIRRSGADVVFLQEAETAKELARLAGMNVVQRSTGGIAVLSRYPLSHQLELERTLAVVVRVGDRKVVAVGMHLEPWPYSPYLACFEGKSSKEILRSERDARRGAATRESLAAVDAAFPDRSAIIVGGDFNAPSHLDWTEEEKSAHCGHAIDFPASKALEASGFVDAYRAVHPSPRLSPGLTWSPFEKYNRDYHAPEPQDRLDMIHFKGDLAVTGADVYIDEPENWPSDHAGVLVDFAMGF